MMDTTVSESTLSVVVRLIGIAIWPLTLLVCVLTQRKVLGRIFAAIGLLAESANKIKVWQVEVERSIDREVQEAALSARLEKSPDIPRRDTLAAARVSSLVASLSSSPMSANLAQSIRLKMLAFASEYEATRIEMPRGAPRTAAMNAIVARMRALAVAARPLLAELSANERSPGARLCAIAILQMTPDHRYIDWLGQRFPAETPFVFYQAAVALAQMVSEIGSDSRAQLKRVVLEAIATIESYRDGTPDPNTLGILKLVQEAMTRAGT